MASVWNKVDTGLGQIYADYLRAPDTSKRVRVYLRYRGDLSGVERAGFQTSKSDGRGEASGTLRLADLETIANCEEVISIRYGTEPYVDLDESIADIEANQVWSQGGAPLFEFTGTTGQGVIIGVIDTGCDIRHPFLWRRSIPTKATRILRLWDMGLEPVGSETSPPVTDLHALTTDTYGVEYTESHINDILQGVSGAMPVRTRDCSGHGTHVASTAAGDGRFKFKFRGVAPRADLVIVKLLHPEKEPVAGGTPVPHEQRFRDAVSYILNVAGARPVVINFSAGSPLGPHDGFDEQAQFLNDTFAGAGSKGRIFVAAAGNDAGDLPDPPRPPCRQHARVVFTGAKTIEVPFELFDTRVSTNDFETCVAKDNTKISVVDFWYPNGGATITARVLFEGESAFIDAPLLGATSSGSFGPGPALRSFDMFHSVEPGRDGATSIVRNLLRIIAHPGTGMGHATGNYLVELTTDAAVTLHCWCFHFRKRQGFRVADPVSGLPAEVIVEDRFLINGTSAVPNVVTVAAYESEPAGRPVTTFSSRGPIVRYDAAHSAAPSKPDIAGPGERIEAAKSQHKMPAVAGSTINLRGTSMAAPHVTGAIALLLQKKNDLTPAEVLAKLRTHASTTPAPVAEEVGAGRLAVKAAVDNTP